MAYESEGIRHIEIQKKNKGDSDDEDSDDSFYNVKTSGLKHDQLLHGDSENVKLDSLLKAVIDISDRLNDQEEKLKKHELHTFQRRSHTVGDEGKLNDEKKPQEQGKKSTRPRTAVRKYSRQDSFESVSSDSDQESQASGSKLSFASGTTIKDRPISGRPVSAKFEHDIVNSKRLSMSFSNDKVRNIDMENQRLLKEILTTKTKAKMTKPVKQSPGHAKSAAAINRSKRQKEIDRENMRLLARLQDVKPTKNLRRDKLLYEHMEAEQNVRRLSKTNKKRPVSVADARPWSSKSRSSRASSVLNFDEESVLSSRMSSVSMESKQSRASSARIRPPRRVVVKKAWEPGW